MSLAAPGMLRCNVLLTGKSGGICGESRCPRCDGEGCKMINPGSRALLLTSAHQENTEPDRF
jgi:hypothetical protein